MVNSPVSECPKKLPFLKKYPTFVELSLVLQRRVTSFPAIAGLGYSRKTEWSEWENTDQSHTHTELIHQENTNKGTDTRQDRTGYFCTRYTDVDWVTSLSSTGFTPVNPTVWWMELWNNAGGTISSRKMLFTCQPPHRSPIHCPSTVDTTQGDRVSSEVQLTLWTDV